MKKRICALFLVVVLAVSLCACGSVESKLDGTTWVIRPTATASATWSFDGDRVSIYNEVQGTVFGQDAGTYEVMDGYLAITWDDPDNGRVNKLYYTYTDGIVQLYSNEECTNALTKVG